MLNFTCSCGYQTDLQCMKVVSSHMGNCQQFRSNSPIHQAFEVQSLDGSSIEQLLIFRADLTYWVDLTTHLLEEKGYIEKKYNLQDYNLFTKTQGEQQHQQQQQQQNKSEKNGSQKQLSIKKPKKTGKRVRRNKKASDSTSDFVKQLTKTHSDSIGLDSLEDNAFNGLQDSFDVADFNVDVKTAPPKKMAVKTELAPVVSGARCVQCGRTKATRSNQIYALECNHNMCQKCFIEMYRSSNPLNCPQHGEFVDKQFIMKAALNSDISSCTICDKMFQKDHNVRRHITTVHLGEVKKFCCDLCAKPFPRYSDIGAHKEIKHGIDRSMTRPQEEIILLDSDNIIDPSFYLLSD